MKPQNSPQLIHLSLIILFFASSISATIATWFISGKSIEARAKEMFYLDSNNVKNWIGGRFDTYLDLLTSVQAFVENTESISKAEWADFINRIKITKKYPGLRAVIYAPHVIKNEVDTFVNTVKKENNNDPVYQDFKIYPETSKDEYYIIKYTEGVIEERYKALGFDVTSETTRTQALFQARDTGLPIASDRVNFIVPPTSQGFLIFLPTYNKNLPQRTIKERQEAITGIIYAPFDSNQFFDSILKYQGTDSFPRLDLEVYDLQSNAPKEPVYDKDQSKNILNEPNKYLFTTDDSYTLNGRTWNLKMGFPKSSLPNPYFSLLPLCILFGGLSASLFAFLLLFYQYRQHLNLKVKNNK